MKNYVILYQGEDRLWHRSAFTAQLTTGCGQVLRRFWRRKTVTDVKTDLCDEVGVILCKGCFPEGIKTVAALSDGDV